MTATTNLAAAIAEERRAADLSYYYDRSNDTGRDYDAAKAKTDALVLAQPVQQPNREALAGALAQVFDMGTLPNLLREADAVLAALAVPATGEVEWGTEIREPDGTLRDRDVWPTEKDARDAAEMYAETLISRTVSPWVVTP